MSVGSFQRHAEGLRGQDAAPQSPTNLPPINERFVGREAELTEIHDQVCQGHTVALTQPNTSIAESGLGKTDVAIAYAAQYARNYPGGLFFVDASTDLPLVEFAKLGDLLGLKTVPNEEHAAAVVLQQLALGAQSLVILDGLDNSKTWNRLQRNDQLRKGNCRCLLTTQLERPSSAESVTIGGLPVHDGARLLASYREDAVAKDNSDAASELVELLAGNPLALTLAGCLMVLDPQLSWHDCRDRLASMIDSASGGVVGWLLDQVIDALSPQHRIALEYSAALPQSQAVSLWLCELLDSEGTAHQLKLMGAPIRPSQQVLGRLLALRILQPVAPGNRILAVHPVLRKCLNQRAEGRELEKEHVLDDLVEMGRRRAANATSALQKKSQRIELSPLVHLTKDLIAVGRVKDAVDIAKQITMILHKLGRLHEALDLLQHFEAADRRGKIDPHDAGVLLSNRAAALAALGKLDDARREMERALQVNQKHLPPDHPTLAVCYSNLAGILKTQGALLPARRLIERAVEIERKNFGENDSRLGLRYWWLGDIELAEDRPAQAYQHYHRAHSILAGHFPPEHQHVRALAKLLKQLESTGCNPQDRA